MEAPQLYTEKSIFGYDFRLDFLRTASNRLGDWPILLTKRAQSVINKYQNRVMFQKQIIRCIIRSLAKHKRTAMDEKYNFQRRISFFAWQLEK